ncbi:MAG: oligopeptide/dipeptide ABC transporter ATP-binding protein [Succinivibrionaceae bacterium]
MSLLDIRNLSIKIKTGHGEITICDNLDILINEGIIYGLVGSSGAGKSLIAKAIIGMFGNNTIVTSDKFSFLDNDLTNMPIKKRRKFLSNYVSIISEHAKENLDPNKTIGSQMREAIPNNVFNEAWYKWPFWKYRFVNMLLHKVGIKDTRRLMHSYPNELSEILCQKVAIAIALGRKPKLLIADNPVSTMTSNSQIQILRFIDSFNKNNHGAVLYVANDFYPVANLMDKIMMLYCGRIVEYGSTEDIINHPHHPFTQSMLDAIPSLNKKIKFREPLKVLKGEPPVFGNLPIGCRLGLRCPYADRECNIEPKVTRTKKGFYCCHFPLNKDNND